MELPSSDAYTSLIGALLRPVERGIARWINLHGCSHEIPGGLCDAALCSDPVLAESSATTVGAPGHWSAQGGTESHNPVKTKTPFVRWKR